MTVTVKTLLEPHCPVDGVNVYVPLAVLLTTAGDHVPVMPFEEVPDKTGTAPPEQITSVLPIEVKVGV